MMFDGYLRRNNSGLATLLLRAAPERGTAYLHSASKRRLDLLIGGPLALVTTPLILLLAGVNRLLHPRQPAFFVQRRVGPAAKSITVVKIRSMGPGSWLGAHWERVTPFRQVLRQFHLDELPQLWQVTAGGLTLVGIRVLPWRIYADLQRSWSPARFARWQEAYFTAPLGLTGVHQVFRGDGKEDLLRFHRDVFYATHATLGFDLYLLWCTVRRIVRLHA